MSVHRVDIAALAGAQAERTGDWSGIAIPAETVMDVFRAAERLVFRVRQAQERGQPIPTGVRIATNLLDATLRVPEAFEENPLTVLPPAQRALLEEVRGSGVLFVKYYGRYGRTIRALERRGLVEKVEPDYSTLGMDGWAARASGVPSPETEAT